MEYTVVTVVRYKKWLFGAGFFSMALFHWPLIRNRNISFYKLMGCGKNGSFDRIPDVQQWAVLVVLKQLPDCLSEQQYSAIIFGKFIDAWWKFFGCEKYTIILETLQSHGKWDGKSIYTNSISKKVDKTPMVVLTRATIRLSKLRSFWRHVPVVSRTMSKSEGLIYSIGFGEWPWVKQATLSIWKDAAAMKQFAYRQSEHLTVIQKTRKEKWYSEDMFVRFSIYRCFGTIRGIQPLRGFL